MLITFLSTYLKTAEYAINRDFREFSTIVNKIQKWKKCGFFTHMSKTRKNVENISMKRCNKQFINIKKCP
jgi:hypothetical protein